MNGVGVIAKGRERKASLPDGTVAEIVPVTYYETPPDTSAHWTTRSLARRFGVSKDTIAQVWADHQFKPWKIDTVKVSTDPLFEEKLGACADRLGPGYETKPRSTTRNIPEAGAPKAPQPNRPPPPPPTSRDVASHSWARRSRIPAFIKLQRSIVQHLPSILAAIEHGLSNGRIESISTEIRLTARIALGYSSPEPLISLAMLSLGGQTPVLLGRK